MSIDPKAIEAARRIDAPTADQMFNGLAHGDATHRAWLREAIDALFSGKPAPSPIMGKTREEVIVEAEEARENEVWDEVLKRVQSAWVAPRSYMQSPLELITDLINERDEAVRDVTLREALEEIQRLCMTRDNYGPGIRSKVELESRLSEIVEICHAVCTSPLSPPEGGEDEKN